MARRAVIPLPQPGERRSGRVSVRVAAELERELKNAVLTLSGPPHFVTITQVIEDALRAHLERLRRSHNRGEPWPDWSGRPVRRGRPSRPKP